MKLIELDEQQDRILRDLAADLGRAAEQRWLRRSRLLARWMLSLERWWDPAGFDEWNSNRIAEYRNSTAWWRR